MRTPPRTPAIWAAVVALVAVGGLLVALNQSDSGRDPAAASTPDGTASDGADPTTGPDASPGPSEPAVVPAAAPSPTSEATAPADGPAADARATVAVTVTSADWQPADKVAEVRGYADAVEADGTCTLSLTRGADSASTSSPAVADVASASCGSLTVPLAALTPGTWTGVLRYDSPTSIGESSSFTIEVSS